MPRRRRAPQPADAIRVVIVESRTVLGLGVREVLDRESDIEVVAQVRAPDEALLVVDEAAPDVILVNLPPGGSTAVEATRGLRREAPDSAFVVLGGNDDDASIVGAIEVGATAHVAERAEPAHLVATIRQAAEGAQPLKDELTARPDLVGPLVDSIRETILADRPTSTLTDRELEVLRLVADGLRNRDIAAMLGISDQTVKNHVSTILHRLGVPNRTRAVARAVRLGWLSPGQGPSRPVS